MGLTQVSTNGVKNASLIEADLNISNAPVNTYFLQTDGSGTLKWAESLSVSLIDGGDFNSGSSIINTSQTYDGGVFT
tara:strand:- start:500 stop:730 length:231 start_codon:yes stop_codon:yes gene_type:complete